MRVIELDTAETYYSLRDRILRGPRERIALVVPPRAAVMEGVGLPLLRRLADRERLEIGLVTADGELARRARRAGLPAFASLGLAQHYRPGWWRGRRRAEWLGLPVGGAPPPAATGRAAVPLAIALILLALALTAAAVVYTLPRATVTLRPATQPAQAIVELADVPARPVALSQPWEATAAGQGAAADDGPGVRGPGDAVDDDAVADQGDGIGAVVQQHCCIDEVDRDLAVLRLVAVGAEDEQ
ncbi:MAG TPA: hypothetical protein PLH39_04190, partial [Promineifilum sp.]|nr:hypothetical protein [Promineifilum sp.]